LEKAFGAACCVWDTLLWVWLQILMVLLTVGGMVFLYAAMALFAAVHVHGIEACQLFLLGVLILANVLVFLTTFFNVLAQSTPQHFPFSIGRVRARGGKRKLRGASWANVTRQRRRGVLCVSEFVADLTKEGVEPNPGPTQTGSLEVATFGQSWIQRFFSQLAALAPTSVAEAVPQQLKPLEYYVVGLYQRWCQTNPDMTDKLISPFAWLVSRVSGDRREIHKATWGGTTKHVFRVVSAMVRASRPWRFARFFVHPLGFRSFYRKAGWAAFAAFLCSLVAYNLITWSWGLHPFRTVLLDWLRTWSHPGSYDRRWFVTESLRWARRVGLTNLVPRYESHMIDLASAPAMNSLVPLAFPGRLLAGDPVIPLYFGGNTHTTTKRRLRGALAEVGRVSRLAGVPLFPHLGHTCIETDVDLLAPELGFLSLLSDYSDEAFGTLWRHEFHISQPSGVYCRSAVIQGGVALPFVRINRAPVTGQPDVDQGLHVLQASGLHNTEVRVEKDFAYHNWKGVWHQEILYLTVGSFSKPTFTIDVRGVPVAVPSLPVVGSGVSNCKANFMPNNTTGCYPYEGNAPFNVDLPAPENVVGLMASFAQGVLAPNDFGVLQLTESGESRLMQRARSLCDTYYSALPAPAGTNYRAQAEQVVECVVRTAVWRASIIVHTKKPWYLTAGVMLVKK